MGTIDLTNATNPTRARVGGNNASRSADFRKRMPSAARRSVYHRDQILWKIRDTPINPNQTEFSSDDEIARATRFIKDLALEMGADQVGVAEFDERLRFTNGEDVGHKYVIVFAMRMRYDYMADIGPRSQDEVHRVYYQLDDLGVRLAHQIGAFGYSARMQPNGGDIPIIAFAWQAGLGELGKHGSLISPELGSSFRLCAVTTDMPLVVDGPQDYGIDEICTNCSICSRFCPGDAISDQKEVNNGVTRWRIDTPKCEPYFHELFGCKICLMVCPFNARGSYKEQYKPTGKMIREAKTSEGLMKIMQESTDLDYDSMEGPIFGDE